MKRCAPLGARLLGALLLLVLGPGGASTAQSDDLPDDPLRGRLLFERRSCNDCHSLAGAGPGIGPDLGRGRFTGSFLDLGAALWNHVPGMSVRFETSALQWPELDAEEATQLVAFLYFIEYLGEPGSAAAGERQFRTSGCSVCHTVGGGGNGPGPDLAELERFASPLYIAQAIWNHGPSMMNAMAERGMPPPSFSEGDLANLSAFIRQRGPDGPEENVLLAPGNPNSGRELFQDRGCAFCHGADGRGSARGPDLSRVDLQQPAEAIAGTMWNHALAMSETMREHGIGWPSFSTPELADLVAYLYFLPFVDRPGDASRGAELFQSRSCADCHSGSEQASHPGPELAGTQAATSPAALVAAMWSHAPIMKEAILAEGRPWPELSGRDLRDLLAYLASRDAAENEGSAASDQTSEPAPAGD